ncbi:MAG: AraC family transcriptional regulator [Desulfobacteraceae bacterium]|jgi:AraC-like DNA-binding protein
MPNIKTFNIEEIIDDSEALLNRSFLPQAVNPGYGSGYLGKGVWFNNGVLLIFQSFSLFGNDEIRLLPSSIDLSSISFFNILSGMSDISYSKPRMSLGDGFSNIDISGYKPVNYFKVKCNTAMQSMIVAMDPGIYSDLTGKSYNELVNSLEELDFKANKKNAPARLKDIDTAIKICSLQALACYENNPHDIAFLQAKALELISLQLRQLDHLTGKSTQKPIVNPDVEKIRYACEILKKEMANPPHKGELARRTGFNEKQLVKGFQEQLGIYPSEYLRSIRLEKARSLILSRKYNVSEAAYSVGYSSPGHFAKAFYKKFGINPKAFEKENKKLSE